MNAPYEEHRDASFQAELYLKRIATGEDVYWHIMTPAQRANVPARLRPESIEGAD